MNLQDDAHRARIALARVPLIHVAQAAALLQPHPSADPIRHQVEELLAAIITARAQVRALADGDFHRNRGNTTKGAA